jgi:aldehyde dehydrogenase (NAD+)
VRISELIERQQAYFATGATLDYSFRVTALKKLSAAIGEMEPDILAALAADLNKSEIEGYMTEIGTVKSEIKVTVKSLSKWMKRKRVKTPLALFPAACYTVPEPYGVALIIAPWNYPFMLTISPLISAIAAGNCAVVKPSAYAPAVAKVVEKLIARCFDDAYCAVVLGSRRENTELLEEKFDYIFFTGSVAVGRVVMEAAAKHLTPVTLELGGKSPAIVDETADIDLAARRLVFGKYMNAGQTCVAPDYVLVHKSKKGELIERLRHHIAHAYPRDASGAVTDYPRIVNEKHFERLCGLMEGEQIVIGGEAFPDRLSIAPAVLDCVSFNAPMMQEEIFGPLLPLIEYDRLDDAIIEIRCRPKPLALYLFSSDASTWQRVEKTVSFGGGCVNDCAMHVSSPHLPFGGVGESGMGQYHGKAGFDTFSHYKGIVNKSTKIDFDLRYRPYDRKKAKMIRSL